MINKTFLPGREKCEGLLFILRNKHGMLNRPDQGPVTRQGCYDTERRLPEQFSGYALLRRKRAELFPDLPQNEPLEKEFLYKLDESFIRQGREMPYRLERLEFIM